MGAYLSTLVWSLRVLGVVLLVVNLWIQLDIPDHSFRDPEVIRYNFSGPPLVWLISPFLRTVAEPLVMLAAAEILRLTQMRANNGNAR